MGRKSTVAVVIDIAVSSLGVPLLLALTLFAGCSGGGSGKSDSEAQSPSSFSGEGNSRLLWQDQMLRYGAKFCDQLKDSHQSEEYKLSLTYYDLPRVFYQIADITKDTRWNDCAKEAVTVYRDRYVLPSEGAVPGYWNFTTGLAQDYLRTGDKRSQEAVLLLAQNAAFASDETPLPESEAWSLSREISYTLIAYLDAESVGGPVRERRSLLVERLLQALDQFTVSRSANFVRPFMIGLAAEALIEYDERVGDPRILPALSHAGKWLWDNTWISSSAAFRYTDRNDASGGTEPAPDLNLLILPLYGWLYAKTGEPSWRDHGDAIFAGGVRQAYLEQGKQFNQNFRWSPQYLSWIGE